jgi:hypothetical protein
LKQQQRHNQFIDVVVDDIFNYFSAERKLLHLTSAANNGSRGLLSDHMNVLNKLIAYFVPRE